MNTAAAAGVFSSMRGVLLVVAIAFSLACGCGHAAVALSPSAPGAEEILGQRAQLRLVLRPAAILRDPLWGPRARRMLAHPPDTGPDDLDDEGFVRLFHASEIDISVVADSAGALLSASTSQSGVDKIGYLFVARGVHDIDPAKLKSEKGERFYSEPETLSSGTELLRPARRPEPGRVDGPLFVFPDGTWVGVGGRTERRSSSVLEGRSSPPGPSGLDSRILFAAFMDPSLTRASWSKSNDNKLWSEGLAGAGLLLYGGDRGALEVVLDYDSSAAAKRAGHGLEREVGAECDRHAVGCQLFKSYVADIGFSIDDRRVSVRFTPSRKLLEVLTK